MLSPRRATPFRPRSFLSAVPRLCTLSLLPGCQRLGQDVVHEQEGLLLYQAGAEMFVSWMGLGTACSAPGRVTRMRRAMSITSAPRRLTFSTCLRRQATCTTSRPRPPVMSSMSPAVATIPTDTPTDIPMDIPMDTLAIPPRACAVTAHPMPLRWTCSREACS